MSETLSHDEMMRISRRGLLGAGVAALPALVLGIRLASPAGAAEGAKGKALEPCGYLKVDQAGAVTLLLPKTEMGQGVNTSIAMLVAEELDVPTGRIDVVLPGGVQELFGKLTQVTGGSTSMQDVWTPVRQVAANARAALIGAAAARWKVPAGQCASDGQGHIVHAASGRSIAYGDLVVAAAAAPIPETAPFKDPKDYRILGKPAKRIDSRAKVTGTAQYGIDVVLPGMKVATLAQAPVPGATVKTVDEAAALKVKGVRQVVRLPDAVAVVADHYWAAKKGLDALDVAWNASPNDGLTQAAIVASYLKASEQPGKAAKVEGAPDEATQAKAMAGAPKRISAVYQQPFLAHATMEPGNCVLHLQADKLEIWTGTQIPTDAREEAAKAAGLPVEKVELHNYLMGGGFGRRLEADYILRAVGIAKQVDGPLKVVWSREEDMQHDNYRPLYVDRIEAGVDKDGMPVAWSHRITGSSIMARLYPKYYDGVDADAVDGAINPPYALPAMRVEFLRHECPVSTSWWRGVGGARNCFVIESFVDELAHAAGKDPIAYRRALARDDRAKAVLDLVEEKSGWKTPLPKGRARGVALLYLWNTCMAQVVEVEPSEQTGIRVVKVTAVVDCGQPVNPLGIKAQIEGGVVFGITTALFGEVTVGDGRIEQSNFHDYQALRINDAPEIDVHIVENHNAVGGMGEPPLATVVPAIANATFALTGKRVRTLPIAKALMG